MIRRFWLPVLFILLLLGGGYAWFNGLLGGNNGSFITWLRGNTADRTNLITVQREPCPGAPFILPAAGFIGLLYTDPRGPYNQLRPHQGIDIFVDEPIGTVPVYAAYDGYITRERDWVSTLIQRIDDPLNPGETVWLYYTHMADEAGNDFIEANFERGTYGVFVPQGTLLGYVGNYDGNVPSRIWTHLHFSIVRDDDNGNGYLNEAVYTNTLDPSPYLKMDVDYETANTPITCQ